MDVDKKLHKEGGNPLAAVAARTGLANMFKGISKGDKSKTGFLDTAKNFLKSDKNREMLKEGAQKLLSGSAPRSDFDALEERPVAVAVAPSGSGSVESGPNAIAVAFNGMETLLISAAVILALVVGILNLRDYIKAKRELARQDKIMDSETANLLVKDLLEFKIVSFYASSSKSNEPLSIHISRRLSKTMRHLIGTYILLVAVHLSIPLMYSLLVMADPDRFGRAQGLFMKNNRPNPRLQLPFLIVALVLFMFNEVFFSSKYKADPARSEETQNLNKLQSRVNYIHAQHKQLEQTLYENISVNSAYNQALTNYLTTGEEETFFRALLMEQSHVELTKYAVSYSLLRTYRSHMPHYRPEDYDTVEATFRGDTSGTLAKKEFRLIDHFMVSNPMITDATEELLKDIQAYRRKTSAIEVQSAFENIDVDTKVRMAAANFIQSFNKQMSKLVIVSYPTVRKPVLHYTMSMGVTNTVLAAVSMVTTLLASGALSPAFLAFLRRLFSRGAK